MTNYMKSCSFLHAYFFEKMKVDEKLFLKKLMAKNLVIEKTLVVGKSNVYLQHMLLKIRKKTIWKFTFYKYHVRCLYLF